MTDVTISWPDGKRVAVLMSVLLETWSEGKAPSYFPRTTALQAGEVDLPARQWSQYGAEEGLWRILGVLERSGVRSTVFSNALSAELHPELMREIVRHGHTVAAHGYAQDQFLQRMSRDEQHTTIRRTLDILEKHAGRRPTGWCTPVYGWNEHTHELLVREGLKWHSDALNRSLPWLQQTPAGGIVAMGWSDFVDNRVLRGSPRMFHDVYIDTFDYLCSEERLGLLHIGFHGHFGGRPMMSAMLSKVLRHITNVPDVWLTTHEELAEWFLARGVTEILPAQRFLSTASRC
jgi:peptidoglycan/xylan/chitin deacetylase (PgdA/CDA1 family)